MTATKILSIGTAVPEHAISQVDAAELATQFLPTMEKGAVGLKQLYRRTGIAQRHSVILDSSSNGKTASQSFYQPAQGPDDHGPTIGRRMGRFEACAGALVEAAALKAMKQARLHPSKITHLVTTCCTGFVSPGVDMHLIRQLGLSRSVARTNLGFMGCHAAINALRMADAIVQADLSAKVLVASVELCSLHQQYGDRGDSVISNALFGDGAAAMICAGHAKGSAPLWSVTHCESTVFDDSAELMSWRIRDHGFEMQLSARVPDQIRGSLQPWCDEWLSTLGLSRDQILSWAVHPGGPRILDAVAAALELSDDHLVASREVLRNYGNMSSPTVLFVLERLGTMGACGPCMMLAFGPGLVAETALLRKP